MYFSSQIIILLGFQSNPNHQQLNSESDDASQIDITLLEQYLEDRDAKKKTRTDPKPQLVAYWYE